MRRFLPTFLIIVLVLAVYPFIGMDESPRPVLKGLPWQIEILPDAQTKIFGLIPGRSLLQDAVNALGDDYQLAVVANADSVNLEMYFANYRAGLMTAKLVLVADVGAEQLQQWQQRALKVEFMASGGAKKFLLAADDRALAMRSRLRAIAFIPAVNLDDDIVRQRFGEPDEVLTAEQGVVHYLFPEKGLVVAVSEHAKEVLQYVAPADFASLRQPLISARPVNP